MNVLNKNINNLFFIFISFHLIIWTVIPYLTNDNLPLDTIEALAWGSNLDWGYSKHPPMSAFFPEVFFSNLWFSGLGLLFIKSNFCFNSFLLCF